MVALIIICVYFAFFFCMFFWNFLGPVIGGSVSLWTEGHIVFDLFILVDKNVAWRLEKVEWRCRVKNSSSVIKFTISFPFTDSYTFICTCVCFGHVILFTCEEEAPRRCTTTKANFFINLFFSGPAVARPFWLWIFTAAFNLFLLTFSLNFMPVCAIKKFLTSMLLLIRPVVWSGPYKLLPRYNYDVFTPNKVGSLARFTLLTKSIQVHASYLFTCFFTNFFFDFFLGACVKFYFPFAIFPASLSFCRCGFSRFLALFDFYYQAAA